MCEDISDEVTRIINESDKPLTLAELIGRAMWEAVKDD